MARSHTPSCDFPIETRDIHVHEYCGLTPAPEWNTRARPRRRRVRHGVRVRALRPSQCHRNALVRRRPPLPQNPLRTGKFEAAVLRGGDAPS